MTRRFVGSGLLALLLTQLWACAPNDEPKKPSSPSSPNVLLVTLDTTRADRIGAYGWKRGSTPTLDQLAGQSVKFDQAFSAIPVTLPSHTSIMTGLYPFYHGVLDNSNFVADPDLHTLAESFKDHDYQTAAVVAAFVLDAQFGLAQGFDTYDDQVAPASEFAAFDIPERNARAVTDSALRWLDSADRDRPFFLWVHYYDPHMPYDAPTSFTHFVGHPYDEEIAYMDSQLGRLLDGVKRASRPGRQLVTAVVGDHGEALGQYGEPTHAYFVYDSTLHVPFLLEMPGGAHAGESIDCPVSTVDVMPTLLDVAGLPVPSKDDIHGRSLVKLINATETPPEFADRPIAFECHTPHYNYGCAVLRGIRIGNRKYIQAPTPELYIFSEGNDREFYADRNQYEAQPDLAETMRGRFEELFNAPLTRPALSSEPTEMDPEVIRKLRALGYAASTRREDDESAAASGPDPKDMLDAYVRLVNIVAMIRSGENVQATHLLIDLLRSEPHMSRLVTTLATEAAMVPSVAPEALETIDEILRTGEGVPPSIVPQVLMRCGEASLSIDQDERALRYFDEALHVAPNDAGALWWKSMACMRLERWAEASEALGEACKHLGPNTLKGNVELGLARIGGGQLEDGLAVWQQLLDHSASTKAPWAIMDALPADAKVIRSLSPLLQRAFQKDRESRQLRATLGLASYRFLKTLGDYQSALQTLEQVRPLLPDSSLNVDFAAAELQLGLGNLSTAREQVDRVYQSEPDQANVVRMRAAVLEAQNEVDAAVRCLEKYHNDHPDDLRVMNDLAWMLARQGDDLGRALKLVKEVLQRLPSEANARDTIGWIYYLQGDADLAINQLGHATRIDPQNASYQYHLGKACLAAGQEDAARQAFAEAVRLAPTVRPDWYAEAVRESATE